MANNDGNYDSSFFFNYADTAPDFTKNASNEYPCHQITVKIRLNPGSITNDLKDRLSRALSAKNMTLRQSSLDIIIVSGIPPDNRFDRNKVLKIVQNYSEDARFEN